MVKTYKSSFMKLGVHNGLILNIETEPNTFFKPAEEESAYNCPHNLTIKFKSTDGMEIEERFVNPSQDYGLYGDICKLQGVEFNNDESEDIDEQEAVGLECAFLVEDIENTKGKVYRKVTRVCEPGTDPRDPNAKDVDISEDIKQASGEKVKKKL